MQWLLIEDCLEAITGRAPLSAAAAVLASDDNVCIVIIIEERGIGVLCFVLLCITVVACWHLLLCYCATVATRGCWLENLPLPA